MPGETVVDEDTREKVTPEMFRQCLEECGEFIELMQDLDRGVVTLTLTERRRIPARTMDLIRAYKHYYRSKKQ